MIGELRTHWQSRSLKVIKKKQTQKYGTLYCQKSPRQFTVCEQFFQGTSRFRKTNLDCDRLSLYFQNSFLRQKN